MKACLHNVFYENYKYHNIVLTLFHKNYDHSKNNRNLHKNNKTVVYLPLFYRIGHNNKFLCFLNQNPYALYKVLIFHNYSCLAPLVSDATCYTYMVVIFFALFTIK